MAGIDRRLKKMRWHQTRLRVFASVAALSLVVTACGSGDSAEASEDTQGGEEETVAGNDWPDTLTFAAVPSEQQERLEESYAVTIAILEEELGVEIEFFQAADYAGVIEGMIAGSVDLAQFGPFSYVIARNNGAEIEPADPRFEDAFIDRLGGGPGGRSGLAENMAPTTPGSGYAVSCRGLTKCYGDFTAADNVTFDVNQGEIFGLLGPNGAGKSTTFKMLCGLLKPTRGEARVAGHDLLETASEAKQQLGYMAQKFSLYGLLSVHQNLRFYSGIYGLSGRHRRDRIDEMVGILGLGALLDRSADELPLGFRQRLALACALMHRPPILFLDERTSGVDPITRREFWTHINGLVRKGVTVLVTTHFMDEAEYCDRVAMMYRSRVIALDTPDALKARSASTDRPNPTMEDAFIAMVDSELQSATEQAA